MKKNRIIAITLCIFLLGLIGCANTSTMSADMDIYSKKSVNWEQGFTVGSIRQGKQHYVSGYQEIKYNVPQGSQFVAGAILRNNVNEYLGVSVYETDASLEYYLEQVPAEGGNVEMSVVSHDWGIENGRLLCFDAYGDCLYFMMGVYESENASDKEFPDYLYMVTTDREGNLQKKVDIMPGLKKLGCSGYREGVYVDGEGYIYISAVDDRACASIFCVDAEGKAVNAYQCKIPSEDLVFKPIRDNRGRIFFPVYEKGEGATKLIWKNSRNEWKELASLSNQLISNWYTMRDNMLYYTDGNMLVRWDVLSGEREKLLDLNDNGIEDFRNLILLLTEEGVHLRYISTDKEWVARMTEEEPSYEHSVDVAVFTNLTGAKFVKSSLASFSREESCEVTVMQPKEDADKSRLLMEVVNGKGPDVLYLPYADMVHLESKGALLEVSNMIPASVLEKMLPGAVEFGWVDGALYGIPTSVQIITMFTNREIWDNTGWSLDDVMELSEKHQDIDCYFTGDMENEDLGMNLIWLLGYDIDQQKSKFIDWKTGTSCFEKNDFMKALEFIKSWEENQKPYKQAALQYARDRIVAGDALGFGTEACEMVFFDMLMDEFGENCYAVGVPAEDRQGTYLTVEGVLVVNANIAEEKKETVLALLNYLIGEECQQKLYNELSVLKGMPESRIVYEEETGRVYWRQNDSALILLHSQADGTTYMEEFNHILEKATPYKGISPIFEIVIEEVVPYFEGQFTALEVTRKIDNRVQLYLDENY